MMQTQINGQSQIKDLSIPIHKLTQELQDRLTATSVRMDWIIGAAQEGETSLSDARISDELATKVYRGVLLTQGEYTISAGQITFARSLEEDEAITVIQEGVPGGAAQNLAASPALPLPTAPSTDMMLIVRDGALYVAPLDAI